MFEVFPSFCLRVLFLHLILFVFSMIKVRASILEGKSDMAMSTLTEIVEDLIMFRSSLCLRDMGVTSLPSRDSNSKCTLGATVG